MEVQNEFYGILIGALAIISQLLIIIGCGILVIKTRNFGSILMLTGAILLILTYLGNIIGPQLIDLQDSENITQFFMIMNAVGNIPYLLFGMGLILFAVQHKKE